MRLTYDPEADALYLKLGTARIARTEEVAPSVMLDLDAAGDIVGVEVLGVSRLPGAEPLQLDFALLAGDQAAALKAIAGWRKGASEPAVRVEAAE